MSLRLRWRLPAAAAAIAALRRPERAVVWLLGLTLLHGSLYAFIVPPWQAPDEPLHYEYLRALVQTREPFPLIIERSANVYQQVWQTVRAFHWWEYLRLPTPPEAPEAPATLSVLARGGWSLYYRLSFPIYYLVQGWPIVGQLFALRLYSVTLQCLTVWLTYGLARLVFAALGRRPAEPLALASAYVVAVFPQYSFIAASYNDDGLVPPLAALALYGLVRGLLQRRDYRWLALSTLGTLLAVLTKRTALGLVVIWGASLAVYAIGWLRASRLMLRVAGAFVLAGWAVVIAALCYLAVAAPALSPRLAALLGLPAGSLTALTGYVRQPGYLAGLDWIGALLFLSVSFWGWFGWLKAPLSTPVMEVLRRVTGLLAVGCGLEWVRAGLAARRIRRPAPGLLVATLLALGLVASLGALVGQFMLDPSGYSLNGRYLFPFISVIGIFAVWGWQAWWPARWRATGVLAGLALLTALDFAALGLVVVPYFYS